MCFCQPLQFKHPPFLFTADKCQQHNAWASKRSPVPSAWHRCPFLWLVSEVTFNEDFQHFLRAGACQASPPGPKCTVVPLLMNLAPEEGIFKCISLHLHLLETQARAPSALLWLLAVAPGPVSAAQTEQQGSRDGGVMNISCRNTRPFH